MTQTTQQKQSEVSNATQNKPMTIELAMEKYQQKILPKLLEAHKINPIQFAQVVINEVKRSPKMVRAFQENPASLFGSILHCAEIGLSPAEVTGEVSLIPFEMRDGNGGKKMTVKPMLGYKGVLKLILRSGKVLKVDTGLVYRDEIENGLFEFIDGTEQKIVHKPNFLVTSRSNSDLVAVYAVAHLTNGEKAIKVMRKDEIVGIQKTLKVDNTLYFDERNDPQNWMARKTVVKQLAKLLEKDFYGMNALEIDSRMEGGKIIVADDSNNLQIKDAEMMPKKNQNIYDVMEIATIEPEPIQEPEKVEENVEEKVESESSLFPKK